MTKNNFTLLALDILKDRYLWKDSEGKVIETPDQMFRRVAKHVASAEKTPEDKAKWEERFYEVMSSLDFLPNSPTLMNAGRPAPHGQLSACFVIGVEDSMPSICEALRKMMLIQKSGGGTGFNFSKLRPKGGTVNSTNGVASGPVSFMKLFNEASEVVHQGGMRRGASMAILNADHPDIREFIHCKDEEGKITNFNLSVGLTDAFMMRATCCCFSPEAAMLHEIAEQAWKTGDPGVVFLDALERDNPTPELGRIDCTNPCLRGDMRILTDKGYKAIADCVGKTVRVWNGEEWSEVEPRVTGIYQDMLRVTCNNGSAIDVTPYHTFILNDGTLIAAKDLLPDMLLSQFELPVIQSDVRDGAEHLLWDINGSPDRNSARKLRVVSVEPCEKAAVVYCLTEPRHHRFVAEGILVGNCGEEPLLPNEACNLGSINLTHMLTSDFKIDWGKYRYVIEVATRFLSNVIEVNQYPLPEIKEAVQKTRKIGLGIMGYAHMLYYMGIAYDSQRAIDTLDDVMAYLWYRSRDYAETELSDRPDHKAFTCIAPTGTLSLIAGVSSGIEPVFSLSHTRTVTDTNGNKREVAVYDPVYEELMSDEADYTEDDIKRIFKTAYTVSPAWHVRTLATAQVWSDAGVSKTVNMPGTATVEDVQNVYIQAWTLGCKGTTVYRDGSKTSQVLKCPECTV